MVHTIRRHLGAGILIPLLSLFFFMILPYPFVDTAVTKCYEPCQSSSDTYLGEGARWLWLGGYHLAPESLLPKDGWPALDNYYDLTYTNAGAFGFGLVSLLFGSGAYAGVRKLLVRKDVATEEQAQKSDNHQ